jgi:hypothetical protein
MILGENLTKIGQIIFDSSLNEIQKIIRIELEIEAYKKSVGEHTYRYYKNVVDADLERINSIPK